MALGISRAPWQGATLLLAACGGAPVSTVVDPNATPHSPPLPVGEVFVLESWGAPAEDTIVTFSPVEDRVVLLRRGAPDNNLFARITLPAGSVTPARGDSVTLRVRPRPGLYGVEIVTDGRIGSGAQVAFSYGLHFVAPGGARTAYGTDLRFERFLAVSRLGTDSLVTFLDSWRIASDVLTAPLAGSGIYLVAAPRSAPRFRSLVW